MKKLSLHLPHLHLSLNRLTKLVTWVLLGFSVVMLAAVAWFSLSQWYQPLQDRSIPEEKLTQKREQLRVKDFDDARTKLEAKQKPTDRLVEQPFK